MMNIKNLANGQLPVSKTTLYTCPAGMTTIVRNIKVTNVHSTNHRFILYYKRSGGTSRVLADHDIDEQDTSIDDDSITMEAGDVIEGQCPDNATYMDYVISGTEETLLLTS